MRKKRNKKKLLNVRGDDDNVVSHHSVRELIYGWCFILLLFASSYSFVLVIAISLSPSRSLRVFAAESRLSFSAFLSIYMMMWWWCDARLSASAAVCHMLLCRTVAVGCRIWLPLVRFSFHLVMQWDAINTRPFIIIDGLCRCTVIQRFTRFSVWHALIALVHTKIDVHNDRFNHMHILMSTYNYIIFMYYTTI